MLFEGAEDVPFDTGPEGVIDCPSETPDDVVPGIEVGCAPDEIVEFVPGTRVDVPPGCISEDVVDADGKVDELSELERLFGRPSNVLVNDDDEFSPDVGDTDVVGSSGADDKDVEFSPDVGDTGVVGSSGADDEDEEFSPDVGDTDVVGSSGADDKDVEFSPDVGDTDVVGRSCADDEVDEISELERLFGLPLNVLVDVDVRFDCEAGEEVSMELCELEGCAVTTLV